MAKQVGRVGTAAGEALRQRAHEAGIDTTDAQPSPASGPLELHVCMGLNACKSHDITGRAKMAGMGDCATVNHVCHGDGECRGQGGCGYAGSNYEQSKPGDQSCRQNGSCASPINESRVFSAGPYKGKSVWHRARAIFEARMYDAGVLFGPSPGEGYPDNLVPPYEATGQGPCQGKKAKQ
ncbi:MAG TPA: hypothetical protein VG186_17840 [Solirubrobacteraceae bacterium]|jgi:hypothetical protein|nr:hypothetical protein [Solirubrobacteraceae bacterium]